MNNIIDFNEFKKSGRRVPVKINESMKVNKKKPTIPKFHESISECLQELNKLWNID